ncbi:OsmC family protein [Bauldia sp.]|uniref:OsmC family protein n=1 Tax=Bauldia sp. TaxID=2575872 RepID=UPI003BACB60F
MAIRTSDAEWKGTLKDGEGHMRLGSQAFEGRYSFASRFEDGGGTNPEELIGAAHAGCYSMALAADLGGAGFSPEYVRTTAKVHLNPRDGGGFEINKIELTTAAKVPGVEPSKFMEIAEQTKINCPVSYALRSVPDVTLDATLET